MVVLFKNVVAGLLSLECVQSLTISLAPLSALAVPVQLRTARRRVVKPAEYPALMVKVRLFCLFALTLAFSTTWAMPYFLAEALVCTILQVGITLLPLVGIVLVTDKSVEPALVRITQRSGPKVLFAQLVAPPGVCLCQNSNSPLINRLSLATLLCSGATPARSRPSVAL